MPKTARDFIYHYERPPRVPLQHWAANILEFLRNPSSNALQGAKHGHFAMGNAALVFAYLGEMQRAREILNIQLSLIAERACTLPTPESLLYVKSAIDPWTNLGRLSVLESDVEAACDNFADIFALRLGEGRNLGPCSITSATWSVVRRTDPRMDSVAEAIYVIDSSKALFVGSKFEQAAEFIGGLDWAGHTALRWLVAEGKLIAAAGLGLHKEVLAATADEPRDAGLYYKSVLAQHNIESRLALGDEGAGPIACGLAILILDGALDHVPAESLVRFIARIGSALQILDERRIARAVYLRGFEIARRIRDQPAEWNALLGLRECGGSPVTANRDWNAAHDDLLSHCHYRSVRRGEGLPQLPSSHLAPIYEELLHFIRTTPRL